jgi:hypothetical protein
MRLRAAVTLFGAMYVAAAAFAEDLKTDKGQPVCETVQDLFTYARAAFDRAERGKYSCRFIKSGRRMEVIKSIPHPDMPEMNIAAVRVHGLSTAEIIDGFTFVVRK